MSEVNDVDQGEDLGEDGQVDEASTQEASDAAHRLALVNAQGLLIDLELLKEVVTRLERSLGDGTFQLYTREGRAAVLQELYDRGHSLIPLVKLLNNNVRKVKRAPWSNETRDKLINDLIQARLKNAS